MVDSYVDSFNIVVAVFLNANCHWPISRDVQKIFIKKTTPMMFLGERNQKRVFNLSIIFRSALRFLPSW